jgi:hypothetical protein
MVIRCESIVGNDDIHAMAGEELADVLPIRLVAAHEATAMQKHHDRSVCAPGSRLVDIEAMARILAIGMIARDDDIFTRLLLQQWSIDFLYQRQVEDRAAGTNALSNLVRNSDAGKRL